MPADNVTPFRRPRKPPPQKRQSGGNAWQSHRGKAVLVHVLTLATYVSAFLFPFPAPPGTPLVLILASCISLAFAFMAVTLAMQNRYDAMPWAATHHEHAIRTLLIGFVVWTLASALTLVTPALGFVAFYARIAVMLWVLVRSVVGFVLAIMRKPIWHPKGLLL
jgi:uncharacterized membrane protein